MAAALAAASAGQEGAQVTERKTTVGEPPELPDEIIVRGRRIGDLRLQIERASEAVFARFNEINSTDDFDIRCRKEKVGFMRLRSCMSNSSREQIGNMGRAQGLALQGKGSGSETALYLQEMLRKERLMTEEMQRLAGADEQLREAVADLSEAQRALTARLGTKTLFREIRALAGDLPYDARLMFEVVTGNDPWIHRLTERTFTLANVFGEIRKVEIECAEGKQRIDYETEVDWTVPDGWSACSVYVRAKKGTTYTLYEF
jgi:hypothetical protein